MNKLKSPFYLSFGDLYGRGEIRAVSGRVGIYGLLSVLANSKVFLNLGYVIKCTVNSSACTIDL